MDDVRTYFGVPVGPSRREVPPRDRRFSGNAFQSADRALPKAIPPDTVNVFEWIIKEAWWARETYLGKPKPIAVRLGRKM